jgi:hypothetical protein
MSNEKSTKRGHLARLLWPAGAGLVGMIFLTVIYFAIVSLAESPRHALELFWSDRAIVIPIVAGFGVQAALYTMLKKRLYVPVANPGARGLLMGAGGATSTVAMVACCLHHATDVLPILGLTAAATFLAQYRIAFMLVGLGTSIAGIAIMLFILIRARRRVMRHLASAALETA